MKRGLLGSTALIGASAMMMGAAGAAEAPEWSLSGNANFQLYWVDQDYAVVTTDTDHINAATGDDNFHILDWNTSDPDPQDHDWYFGVDEAELQLDVSGAADNGLKYGFKIEINANTTDGPDGIADEARIELSGGWGTLQMGDEDGAEDIMNVGGEDLMGATGGFDGDQDDYLVYAGAVTNMSFNSTHENVAYFAGAPSWPTIAGDTGDATKISYYSPRFSGFQVGVSITPTPNSGDSFKEDGDWENHFGLGANYDNTFGNLHIQASAVYSAATNNKKLQGGEYTGAVAGADANEDVGAWSVGGIVGWGPFSVGANYTDNSDSGMPTYYLGEITSYYWDAAARFETGAMGFALGYFQGVKELPGSTESVYDHIALTADYAVAPGLDVYAEVNLIENSLLDNASEAADPGHSLSNDITSLVVGVSVSF